MRMGRSSRAPNSSTMFWADIMKPASPAPRPTKTSTSAPRLADAISNRADRIQSPTASRKTSRKPVRSAIQPHTRLVVELASRKATVRSPRVAPVSSICVPA
jgi:hypothetical protein